jgi:hypothetical protein
MKRKPLAMNVVAERLAAMGVADAMSVYEANKGKDGLPYEERVITDMVGKLAFYGTISDKAVNFMAKLLKAIPERAERDALRKAETEAAKEIPADMLAGRVKVTGTVLTVKTTDTRYGPATKMLIKHADGWKLWGTVPAAARGALERGDTITVEAKLTVSDNDAKFGFIARPKLVDHVKAITETKEAA